MAATRSLSARLCFFLLLCRLSCCFGSSLFATLTHPSNRDWVSHQVVESGSHVFLDDEAAILQVAEPSSMQSTIRIDRPPRARTAVEEGKQWLAWYAKSCLPCTTSYGFKSFQSTWQVPPLPAAASNLAIFNGLEASYDPEPWNWILQPVLVHGEWMLGTTSGWQISGVMCPESGSCLWSKPIATQPGHQIVGTISLIGNGPPYTYNVTAFDATWKNSTSLIFTSNYFAPWAFVSLEHNPAGSLSTCSQLPAAPSITFTNNVLVPQSEDSWAGAQNDLQCGLAVENFVFDDSLLTITL